jgi:hypothetical protein
MGTNAESSATQLTPPPRACAAAAGTAPACAGAEARRAAWRRRRTATRRRATRSRRACERTSATRRLRRRARRRTRCRHGGAARGRAAACGCMSRAHSRNCMRSRCKRHRCSARRRACGWRVTRWRPSWSRRSPTCCARLSACALSICARVDTCVRLQPGWRLTRALPPHRLAQVGPADTLLDVGCGDGRVVVAAAALCGCCATGVEIEARVVALAQRALEAWAPQSALPEACCCPFLVALLFVCAPGQRTSTLADALRSAPLRSTAQLPAAPRCAAATPPRPTRCAARASCL